MRVSDDLVIDPPGCKKYCICQAMMPIVMAWRVPFFASLFSGREREEKGLGFGSRICGSKKD